MLKTLRGENFQSWRELLMTLSPGVNVIVGESDAGKSAIMRMLRLLITNRPSGDAYRSWWGGDTVI